MQFNICQWIKLHFCRQNNWTLGPHYTRAPLVHAILKLQIKFILFGEWHTSSRCSRFIVQSVPSAGCCGFLRLSSGSRNDVTSSARPRSPRTHVIILHIVCVCVFFSALAPSPFDRYCWILFMLIVTLPAPSSFNRFANCLVDIFVIYSFNLRRLNRKKKPKCSATEDICEKQWQQWHRRATELSWNIPTEKQQSHRVRKSKRTTINHIWQKTAGSLTFRYVESFLSLNST